MVRLSNREVKELNALLGTALRKSDIAEICNVDSFEVLKVNGSIEFFRHRDKWVPALRRIYREGCALKGVAVDAGAVKFIANGADVMRPGIVDIEDGIGTGDIIAIREKVHGKVIAIGEALFPSIEMIGMERGKAVKNLHYIGDVLWKKH